MNNENHDDGVSAFEFEGWAILELMGHRKLGGYVRMNGPMIRIDMHDGEKEVATQWYGAHSLYCLTPTTEEIAKKLARAMRPAPVTKFDLLPPPDFQRRRPIDDDPDAPGEFDDLD